MEKLKIKRLDFPYQYAREHLQSLKRESMLIPQRRYDHEQMVNHQTQELKRILLHAYQSCPYYTRMFDQAGFQPEALNSPGSLESLPLLTRSAVREQFYDLCSDQVDLKNCYIKQTSGSTGEPIKIVLDYSINMLWDVLLLQYLKPYGITPEMFHPLRTGIIFVTAYPTSTSFTFFSPILNYSRFYKLSLYPERWESPDRTLEFISVRDPQLITGMPEHLVFLMELMKNGDAKEKYPIRPKLLLASGNRLNPHDKQDLEACFGVPVVDIYALTEFGYLAHACHTGKGYHVDDSLILEILSEDGKLVSPGESGEIIVTSLRNHVMPLIRYRTGDFGRLAKTACSCGSQWPLLAALEGRTNEFFIHPNGAKISPFVFIKHLDKLPIKQYQVVQSSLSQVLIQYIPTQNESELAKLIIHAIQKELGPSVTIMTRAVSQIGESGRKVQNFIPIRNDSGMREIR